MLTDTALRNFKPKSKIYKAFDRDGMYVTVSPVGTVTFRYDSVSMAAAKRCPNHVFLPQCGFFIGPHLLGSRLSCHRCSIGRRRTLIGTCFSG
jgi:hypothetical protein